LPAPNSVIGNTLQQHPGAFAIGNPEPGTFFVGVFAAPLATANPAAAVYLWETSGSPDNSQPFAGPQIQLGFWDGAAFTAYGVPQPASYQGTGVYWYSDQTYFEITSSVTPLVNFGISPDFPSPLNAVRIEAAFSAHNQVTAVAANIVPEPRTLLPVATGLAVLLLRLRKSRTPAAV
jgi:hypothetical protein